MVRRQDHHHRLPKGGVIPSHGLPVDARKAARSIPGRLFPIRPQTILTSIPTCRLPAAPPASHRLPPYRAEVALLKKTLDIRLAVEFAVRQIAFAAQHRAVQLHTAVQIPLQLLQRAEQLLRTFVRLINRLGIHRRTHLPFTPAAEGRRGKQPFDICGFVVDLVADLRAGQQSPFAVTLQRPLLNVQQQADLLVVEPVLQRLVLSAA